MRELSINSVAESDFNKSIGSFWIYFLISFFSGIWIKILKEARQNWTHCDYFGAEWFSLEEENILWKIPHLVQECRGFEDQNFESVV